MSAEKVIVTLLKNNTPLNAVVPSNRIFPDLIPLGTTLPAIAYSHVSTVENTAIGLSSLKTRSRIQVTLATTSYGQIQSITKLIKTACNHKQGLIGGVNVDSVILEVGGADFRDDDANIRYRTIDFRVAFDD
jgi:hypothetical protein